MVMGTFQIGKNGITYNFFHSLENMFKHHSFVKISVLKSARGEDGKAKVKEYAAEILKKMGKKYTVNIIGFTIILKKWRKEQE